MLTRVVPPARPARGQSTSHGPRGWTARTIERRFKARARAAQLAPGCELTRQGTDARNEDAAAPHPPPRGRSKIASPADDPDRVPVPASEATLQVRLERLAQILLGLFSVAFAIYVLASPQLSVTGLLELLGEAVGLLAAQTILAGGRLLAWSGVPGSGLHVPRRWWRTIQAWGILALGLLALSVTGFAVLDPTLAETAAVFILAIVLVALGLGRVFQVVGVTVPRWLLGSRIGTGVIIVALVLASIAFNGFALYAFAIIVGVILLVSGLETTVAGFHPTDPRQFVLLKLILFSSFYGLILINWIDLFGKTVPSYGIWLILTYMAPFGVLIVFEGLESWPLAVSLGLLVSLNNDLGYFFVGNLIFGFHVALGPWIAGQLGFQGSQVVTVFYAGRFALDVTSWMMGLSIYLRTAVVGAILYYWWEHPGEIIARSAVPASGAVS